MNYLPAWTDPLRHPRLLGVAHRVAHRRGSETACIVCRYVWRRLETQPGFREDMAASTANLEAGGGTVYRIVDGELFPVER